MMVLNLNMIIMPVNVFRRYLVDSLDNLQKKYAITESMITSLKELY